MLNHAGRSVLVTSVVVALAVLPAIQARGDFVVTAGQEVTVNTVHYRGDVFDDGRAYVVLGGNVNRVYAWDSGTVAVSGGSVSYLYGYGSSTVNVSDGSVAQLMAYESNAVNISGGLVGEGGVYARGSSTVDVSGGLLMNLYALDNSNVDFSGGSANYVVAECSSAVHVSGGSVTNLYGLHNGTVDVSGGSVSRFYAYDSSTVTFHARNFQLSAGLTLEGEYLRGAGALRGEWLDGTVWRSYVSCTDPGATMRVIPEPATLLVLALGGLGLLRRRGRNGR